VGLIIVTAITIAIAVMLHVVHSAAITCLEAVAEFATVAFVDRRMLVHLVIIGIGVTAIHVVTAGSLYTFTEALALRVAITVGSAIPIAIAILILVLSLGSAVLRIARVLLLGGCLDCCRGCHAESQSGNREQLYVFHKISNLHWSELHVQRNEMGMERCALPFSWVARCGKKQVA
jgi:hypothetical protein